MKGRVFIIGDELPEVLPDIPVSENYPKDRDIQNLAKFSDMVAFPVVGHCMEGAGIEDGGKVVVDFKHFPRPERLKSRGGDGSYDCCLCQLKHVVGDEPEVVIKAYDGKWGAWYCLSTKYLPERNPYAPMQQGLFAAKIYGVIIASYGKDGKLKWKRDPSTFPTELSQESTIHGENCGDPMPLPLLN